MPAASAGQVPIPKRCSSFCWAGSPSAGCRQPRLSWATKHVHASCTPPAHLPLHAEVVDERPLQLDPAIPHSRHPAAKQGSGGHASQLAGGVCGCCAAAALGAGHGRAAVSATLAHLDANRMRSPLKGSAGSTHKHSHESPQDQQWRGHLAKQPLPHTSKRRQCATHVGRCLPHYFHTGMSSGCRLHLLLAHRPRLHAPASPGQALSPAAAPQ